MWLVRSSTMRCVLAGVLCALPGPLLAEEDEPAIGDGGSPVSRTAMRERPELALVTWGQYFRRKVRSAELDWGTGGVALLGIRTKAGRKRQDFLATQGAWRSAYEGEVGAWGDVGPGLTLEGRVAIARDTNGRNGAPLLTRRTGGFARSASLELRGRDDAALTLTAFDRYGWSGDGPEDIAERLNNAEGMARRGIALEWSVQGEHRGRIGGGSRFGLALERSYAPGGEADNAARLSMQATF